MNSLIGSIVELESSERGKVAIKLKDNEYALKYGAGGKFTTFHIKEIKQIIETKQMRETLND